MRFRMVWTDLAERAFQAHRPATTVKSAPARPRHCDHPERLQKPASDHRTASRCWRTCLATLALLLGFASGVMADEFRIGGTGSALGIMRLLAADFMSEHPDVHIKVLRSLGSSGGIKAATAGAIELGVSSRPLKESERGQGAVEMEFARTPFVFTVSFRSKASVITSDELADIYAGKMKTWADGSPIRIVLRPDGDIDTEIIKSISRELQLAVMAAEARPGGKFSMTDQDAADDLERIRGAFGPSSLVVILSEKRALRALVLDGKEPTLQNAASGAYPYYKRLFLVTGATRPPNVERFIEFVRSSAGRRILANNGLWIP